MCACLLSTIALNHMKGNMVIGARHCSGTSWKTVARCSLQALLGKKARSCNLNLGLLLLALFYMYNISMRTRLYILGFIIVVVTLLIFLWINNKTFCSNNFALVTIGDKTYEVEVANTASTKKKGLSGHEKLNENTGMIFYFEEPIIPTFWMKDMLFPLDILWIDENNKIVGLQNDLDPSSYPKTYYPNKKIKYVLEVSSDSFSDSDNLIEQSVSIVCK